MITRPLRIGGMAAVLVIAFICVIGAAQFELPGLQPPADSGNSINFGAVAVGTTKTASYTFKILETSETSATVRIYPPSPPFGLQDAPSGPFTLAPGQSITFGVTFTPAAAGDYTGSFTITAQGGYPVQEKTTTVYLTGHGGSGGESPPPGETPPTPGITIPFIPPAVEVPAGAISVTTDEKGKFKASLTPTTTVAGRLTRCDTGQPLADQPFQLAKTAEGFSIIASGYAVKPITKFSKFSIMGLESYDVGTVCLTLKEDCSAIQKKLDELSQQIDEKKKACGCDSLERELAELEAKLANAQEDLKRATQKKTKLQNDLKIAEQDFKVLLQRIGQCLGGAVWVYEYKDTDDLKREASQWGVGRGASYIGSGRKGVPGGIGVIGPVEIVNSSVASCRGRYRRTYGESLSAGFTRLQDLRVKKHDLDTAIKKVDATISTINQTIFALNNEIAQKRKAIEDCKEACANQIEEMQQKKAALSEALAECRKKLTKQQQKEQEHRDSMRQAQAAINKANEKIGYAEDEAKLARDAIEKAEKELQKHVNPEDARQKLALAERENKDGLKELGEAKKELADAKKSYAGGDPEQADQLAQEALKKAQDAYNKLLRANTGAKGAGSLAREKNPKCSPVGYTQIGSPSIKFVWKKILGIVKVPFALDAPGKCSDKEIEDYLERQHRYEQAQTFMRWVGAINDSLDLFGGLGKGGAEALAAVIKLGEKTTTEITFPSSMTDEIFKIWTDIMNRSGWQIYIKVSGYSCKIQNGTRCEETGRQHQELRVTSCEARYRYVYLGVIQKHRDLGPMKTQLEGLLKRSLPGMIEAGSLTKIKVTIK